MASANTNKTIWTVAIIAILGFLAWKLWPAIRRQINGGGGGGGVGGGAAGSNPTYPFPQIQSPTSGLGLSAGLGGGQQGQPGGAPGSIGGGSLIQDALAFITGEGTYSNSSPAQQGYIDALADQEGSDYTSIESAGLPLETTQNFDVNQLAYSPGDDASDYDGGLDTTSYFPGVDDQGISDDGGDNGGGGDDSFDDFAAGSGDDDGSDD